MEILIQKYKITRVPIESEPFTLPTETVYMFETGIRRAIRIVPVDINEQNKKISYEITCIHCDMRADQARVFRLYSEDIESLFHSKSHSYEKDFVNSWVSGWFDVRTEEQFNADMESMIRRLKGEN